MCILQVLECVVPENIRKIFWLEPPRPLRNSRLASHIIFEMKIPIQLHALFLKLGFETPTLIIKGRRLIEGRRGLFQIILLQAEICSVII